MKRIGTCISMTASILAGCASTLKVERIEPGRPAEGYPYQLRYTQFEVAVTWQVVKCDATKPQPLSIKITAVPRTINPLDPDHLYAIDPGSLQGLFRTTAFSMEWFEDRGPKAINSAVDDQSGAAIVGALTGVARLAALDLGASGDRVPLIGGSAGCSDIVTRNLLAIQGDPEADRPVKGQAAITDEAQEAVAAQTAIVARLSARVAAAGAAVDERTRSQFVNETTRLEALNALLEQEKAKLKELFKPLTETATVRWPLDGRTLSLDSTVVRPSDESLERWNAKDPAAANVYFALRAVDGYGIPIYQASTTPRRADEPSLLPAGERPTPRPVSRGLPYREPRPMRLYVCKQLACPGTIAELQRSEQVLHASDVQVFQAGGLHSLPFSAMTFANTTNSAGFSQSGVLISAGTTQPRGAGSALVTTFADGSAQIVAGVQADRTAETARLTAETNELTARRAYEEARRSLTSTDDQQAIAAYAAEASLATAERTAIEARLALELARAQLAARP